MFVLLKNFKKWFEVPALGVELSRKPKLEQASKR